MEVSPKREDFDDRPPLRQREANDRPMKVG